MNSGIGYAVLAALLWGVYLFALKRFFDRYSPAVLTVLVNALGLALYLPVAALTLPAGSLPDPGAFVARDVLVLAATVVAVAAGFVLFLRALAVGEVSYVAPINKLVPVFVLPLEVGLLGARLSPVEMGGVLVATLAVYVANYSPGELLAPVRQAAASRPARLALLSAACYAVGDLGKRVALQELGLPPRAWVPLLLAGVLVVLLPSAIRTWPAGLRTAGGLRAALPKLAAAAVLVVVAEHITSLAFAAVPASIASPIVNTQAVVAVTLGGLVLREDALRLRLTAAGLAVGGVSLIAV